jgi:very-short-patch-repair endonuclease
VAPLDAEPDARRDIDMGAAGFVTVRFSESEVWYDPKGTVARWRAKRDEMRRKRTG